jgi:DnaJ-class molecular chaperone
MSAHACLDCDSPGDGHCAVCHGKGRIPEDTVAGAFGVLGHDLSCPSCDGSGHCQKCDGSGEVEVGGEA